MTKVTLDKETFLDVITKAKLYMSKDETRYYLIGQFIEFGDVVKITATDGCKLFNTEIATIAHEGENISGILPAYAVDLFILAIKKSDKALKAVTLDFDGYTFELDCFTSKTTVKAIDGNYPNYTKVIPTIDENSKIVTMDAEQFVAASKVISGKQGMSWVFNKDGEPLLVRPFADIDAPNYHDKIVLMPMRNSQYE